MCMCVLWIVFLNWVSTTGQAFSVSGVNICTTRRASDLTTLEVEYCLATKDDVNLGCHPNKIAVLSSMRFAVKDNFDACTKRVISHDDIFCCRPERNDVLYDGECLQDIWSNEDVQHYRRLIQKTAVKCKNTHTCVLTSDIFRSLQKEIPTIRTYSSYIQLNYHCISAPTDPLEICSSNSVTGKEIHLQNTPSGVNRTCTCRLKSHQSNSDVKVRAVDVRTANSEFIMKSDFNIKDLSHQKLPINGFKEIISGQNIQISARNGLSNNRDNIWLHISGSDGQDVEVACEVTDTKKRQPDTTTQMKYIPPPTGRALTIKKKSKLDGYWPVIYLGAGSGITLILIACIIGSLLICRFSLKKTKPRCENPYNQSQVNYNRSGQYDTVPGGMPNIPDSMTASIQDPYEWPHAFVK